MKKFKLIKKYPSLLNCVKIGDIIQDTNLNNGAKDGWFSENWGKSNSCGFKLNKNTNPQDYPEFWEPIEYPLNYEDLEYDKFYATYYPNQGLYIFKHGCKLWKVPSGFIHNTDGDFTPENGFLSFREATKEEEIIEKNYEILSLISTISNKILTDKDNIYSVKRLSDSEIFTIGDKTNSGTIESFKIVENRIMVNFIDNLPCFLDPKGNPLLKEPIFITEDGVKCYDDTYNLFSVLTKGTWETRRILPSKAENYPSWKHFHTKEARENYILYNKPILSLNEVNAYLCKINVFSSLSKLKELVKSRL
jgi:hypothetical protein